MDIWHLVSGFLFVLSIGLLGFTIYMGQLVKEVGHNVEKVGSRLQEICRKSSVKAEPSKNGTGKPIEKRECLGT